MKRIALGILAVGVVTVVGHYVLIIALTVLKFGEPPSWTFGEGKFSRFKSVARCSELQTLLRNEQPEEFNRRRKELGLSNRYLDLKGLHLVGKDLAGVDLSRCILTGCDFSGCDLRGASFRKSYIAQTSFCGPISVQVGPITPKMARVTDLAGSHFDGATFKATVYYWVEMSCIHMDCEPRDLQFCRTANSTGIPAMDAASAWELPITVSSAGPTIAPLADKRMTNVASVSSACVNPFRDIPDSGFERWSAMGVDIQKLRALPAYQVDPSRLAFPTQTLVNTDSNCVVVLADRLPGMMTIVSPGPLVLMNQARGIRHLVSGGIIWVRDEAEFDNTSVGNPIVLSGARPPTFGRVFLSQAYLWPEDGEKGRNWPKRLLESKSIEEVARMLGHSTPLYIQPVGPDPNLGELVGENKARQLLSQHPELATARLAVASGTHFGARSVDIVQSNPNVTLLLQQGFATHGAVFSAGPVIVIGGAQARPLLTKSWIDGASWQNNATSLK